MMIQELIKRLLLHVLLLLATSEHKFSFNYSLPVTTLSNCNFMYNSLKICHYHSLGHPIGLGTNLLFHLLLSIPFYDCELVWLFLFSNLFISESPCTFVASRESRCNKLVYCISYTSGCTCNSHTCQHRVGESTNSDNERESNSYVAFILLILGRHISI